MFQTQRELGLIWEEYFSIQHFLLLDNGTFQYTACSELAIVDYIFMVSEWEIVVLSPRDFAEDGEFEYNIMLKVHDKICDKGSWREIGKFLLSGHSR